MGFIVMAKITKMVANKRSITRTIVSSAEANHDALGKRLEDALFDGQPPAALTMADVVRAIGAKLQNHYTNMEEQDREVATEVAQDNIKRTRRDVIVERLRQRLISLRGMVEADFGNAAAAHLGLIGTMPSVPDQLVTHTNNVLRRIEDDFDDFKPLFPELGTADFAARSAAIAKDVANLSTAIAALDQDVRETQDVQNLRNIAIDQWTKTYSPVAAILENLYRMADMPAHADRVRPTNRRRAGVPEPEDLENEPAADDVLEDDHKEVTLDA